MKGDQHKTVEGLDRIALVAAYQSSRRKTWQELDCQTTGNYAPYLLHHLIPSCTRAFHTEDEYLCFTFITRAEQASYSPCYPHFKLMVTFGKSFLACCKTGCSGSNN